MNSKFFNAVSKIRYLALLMFLTLITTNAWGDDYELVSTITDGEYVIGAVKGSAGTDTHIYAINNTDNSSWKAGVETTPSGGKISNPASTIVWTLTTNGTNGFSLKNGTKYLTVGTGTGSGTVRANSTTSGTIYYVSTGSNSTFEISGVSTFTISSGNQVGYNIGSGYRQYANRTHSTQTGSGQISVQFRFYKKATSCSVKPTVGSALSSVSATTTSITATVPISAIGGCNITENGLVYSSTNSTPTVGGSGCTKVTTTACGSTAANKTVTISGLTCGTTYYVRGYATNAAGTSYTNTKTQSTSACPKYTVTLKDDDTELAQASAGASVTLPSRTGCTGYTFAGWTKSWATAQTTWTTTAPTIIPAGNYTPTANENLYPVYTKTEGGGTTTVTKVYSGANTADVQFSTGSNSSSNSLVNNTGYTAGNVNVKFAVTSGTNYSYYDGSVVRYYANNTITITPNSATITKVQFVRSSTTSSNGGVISTTGLTASNSNTSTNTNEYTGSTTSAVTFTNNAQCRFSAINVTYTYSSNTTSYISVPNCCTALGTINGPINCASSGDGIVTVSGWTYAEGSTGTTESNVTSYTVKLYKWNSGTSTWALANNNSTTGGASGTQATRTGIAANNKSVTFSGLEYGETYKFTVQAIGNGSTYCDGEETAATSINGNALTDNKFLNKYSIYIDNGNNANYAHNWINSLTSHNGSVDITLSLAEHDYYQYKLSLGGVIWWGNTGKMTTDSKWTFTDGAQNCKLTSGLAGTYTFTFYGATTEVGVEYPKANQPNNRSIWFDKSVITGWTSESASDIFYRIGKTSHNTNNTETGGTAWTLVPGTDRFYTTKTMGYNGFVAWQIANNKSWSGDNSIYLVNGSGYAITKAINFQKSVVGASGVTVVPTTSNNTENGCNYWNVDVTDGMLKHTATISSYSNGTVTVAYTKYDGTGSTSFTSGSNSDLAHRTILTITATPATGYKLTSLQVNGSAFTSGNTHILAADATIAATFTAKTYDVTLDREGATTGSTSVTMTYNSSTHTDITAPTKTGYTFGGWWSGDNGTGSMVMNASGVLQANVSGYTGAGGIWTKDATCTLHAKWTVNNYTLTWNLDGGTVTTAGTGAAVNATGTPNSSVAYGTAITAPVVTKTGYDFTGWSPSVASTMPAAATTYTAQWEQKKYTVTWHVGESTSTKSNVTHGTTFSTLEASAPAHADNALAACGSTKFIGWVKASGEFTEDGKTVDWYNTHKFSGSDEITADTHVYAMYAEASGGNTTIFTEDFSSLTGGSFTSPSNTETTTSVLTQFNAVSKVYAAGGGVAKLGGSSSAGSLQTKTLTIAAGSTINISFDVCGWTSVEGDINITCDNSAFTQQTITYTATRGDDASCMESKSIDIEVAVANPKITIATSTKRAYIGNIIIKTSNYSNYRTGCTVSCGAPSYLTNTSITKTGATIGWTGGGNGTLSRYEYAVWVDGDEEPTSGFTSNGTNTSKTLTGLYSGIKYNWKVRKVCTGSDGESRWSYSSFTTTAATLTFSVPTGVAAVSSQASNDNLPEAGVPTSCGSCWAFAGWTASTTYSDADAPADLMPAGTKARVSGDKTLYAVYKNDRFQMIYETSDMEAGKDYVVTFYDSPNEYALSNAVSPSYASDAAPVDITSLTRETGEGYFIFNPTEAVIWSFSGTTSSGQLYNAAANNYVNLTGSGCVVSTTDNLTFSVNGDSEWTISSTKYLRYYSTTSFDAVSTESDYTKMYIYKRVETSYATDPACDAYTVTWMRDKVAISGFESQSVTQCEGITTLPGTQTKLTCSDVHVGWSASEIMPASDVRPADFFTRAEDAPEITGNTTFYAVFADQSAGAATATNTTYTFNSAAWGDETNSWSSGAAGNALTSNRGVQVTEGKSGANATTKDDYTSVTKVTVTYSTNSSSGVGTISIKVNDVAYTGSASVTKTGGTADRTIDYTPSSSAQTGKVNITVTCTDNSVYVKSVQIFYTGSGTTYSNYRTSCCNNSNFTFGTIADPVTEYVIVREDLESASDAVEIDCNYQSANTTGAIAWYSTRRAALGFPATGAYTWTTPSSQPTGLNIDVANKKISATATGVWTITLSQVSANNYCPADAVVTVRVKTLDKFIDNVNGNFGGDAQAREDVGDGIVLPTEAEFSTNNGCADGKVRRLVGWIKASDLATYRTSGRINTIDDLKTADASNKVIAPGTRVSATGCTWYAVWGTEQ